MARGAKSGYSMTPAESAEPKPAYEPFAAEPAEWIDVSSMEDDIRFDLPMKAQIDEKVMEVEK